MPPEDPEDILPIGEPSAEEVLADESLWAELRQKYEEQNQEIWALIWAGGVLAAYFSGEKRVAKASNIEWVEEGPSQTRAKKWFIERGLMFVQQVSDTDIVRLKNLVLEHWGENERTFARTVEDSPISDEARLRLMYRTETHTAHEGAAYQFAWETGHQFKRWHDTGDTRVREKHRKGAGISGMVLPIDQPFANGLLFPGEVGCRCWLEYFFESPSNPSVGRNVAPFTAPLAVA